MIRRYAGVLALAGCLAVGGAAAAVARASASPATATAGRTFAASLFSNQPTAGAPSTAAPGAWGGAAGGRHGRFRDGGFGRGLTVTGVSGNTITATGRGGQTVTVQVSATTAYTEAGASAALSDIRVGSLIAVQGSYAATNATTINATGVTIVLPRVAGVVTNTNGSTLTLTEFDGATRTVTVSGSTHYQKAGQSAALSDISTGTAIVAEGTLNSDGSLTALRVTIQVPRIGGQVSAVNGSSYTVSGPFGAAYTVNTTGSTSYVNPDGSAAAASAVKTGGFIMAEGSLSSDGKTLTAQRIIVVPAGAGRGFGRHGGFGRGGVGGASGAFGPAFGASASPSSTGTQSV